MAGAASIQLSAFERGQVALAQAYIDAHLQDELKPEQVARMYGISVYKLNAGLVQETGCRFATYIKRKRMERARDLLLGTNKIIYETAKDCGYKDSSSFTRAFRKAYGCTPDAFRKK